MKRFDRWRVVFRQARARSRLGTACGYRLMPDSNLRTCAVVPGRPDFVRLPEKLDESVEGQSCDMRRLGQHDGRRRREPKGLVCSLEPDSTAVTVALSVTPWQRVAEFEWRMIW